MMGHREVLKDGLEVDAIYGKRIYKYIHHHSHKVKHRMMRRNRRKERISLRAVILMPKGVLEAVELPSKRLI